MSPLSEAELNDLRMGHVSFGPKPWQVIDPEVASMVLSMWRERQPAQFGAYLAEVMTGEPPRSRKARS